MVYTDDYSDVGMKALLSRVSVQILVEVRVQPTQHVWSVSTEDPQGAESGRVEWDSQCIALVTSVVSRIGLV